MEEMRVEARELLLLLLEGHAPRSARAAQTLRTGEKAVAPLHTYSAAATNAYLP